MAGYVDRNRRLVRPEGSDDIAICTADPARTSAEELWYTYESPQKGKFEVGCAVVDDVGQRAAAQRRADMDVLTEAILCLGLYGDGDNDDLIVATFHEWDTSGDGILSCDEFCAATRLSRSVSR
eukprot:SAG31_NODE_3915_length_3755_cov_1.358862_3_plen_124_part_00